MTGEAGQQTIHYDAQRPSQEIEALYLLLKEIKVGLQWLSFCLSLQLVN
jgi:hypothetical protein